MNRIFKDSRKREYLNPEGTDRPLRSPVPPAVLDGVRGYRMARIRAELDRHDCAAILLYDPINIRYAFDSRNMQLWTAHNAVRYALIVNGGPGILFECKDNEHISRGLPHVDEIRVATSWLYMTAGEHIDARVAVWADEIAAIVREHGGGNNRIAIDKVEPLGLKALEDRGLAFVEGQELTERARAIKSEGELELMRWTIRVCEAGMARMYEASEPGWTEQEIWAELHHENARSGGEWIETRLLTAGQRTNPWYSECSDYVISEGEMISFDTDMIGPYGYCADLSRSWTCGHVRMTNRQRSLYALARAQIDHNLAVIHPGMSFREFNEKSWRIPERNQPFRYSLALHGVGLADEWPVVPLHTDFDLAYEGTIEENMTLCVESLVAEPGSESIKLETQVAVTAGGAVRLDSFPWEDI